MSDPIESTQPVKATEPSNLPEPQPGQKPDSTQEIKPQSKKKKFRIGRFILNTLIFLLIVGLGIASGYFSGITIRRNAQHSLITQQLSDQFSRALVDIEFGNYNTARQRLE